MAPPDAQLARVLARVRESEVPPTLGDLEGASSGHGDASVADLLRHAEEQDLVTTTQRDNGEVTYSLTLGGHALVGEELAEEAGDASPY